jgi:carbamoyl-phosphate synthase large subunit
MVVIEMNPRVSRSSALASKATGFPIAKFAAKLAVGYSLDELQNDVTKETPACFEPSIDYVVTKIPRFTFEKFPETDSTLTSAMKSVGEAMAIGRTFKESFQKAMRSLEIGLKGFDAGKLDGEDLDSSVIRAGVKRPSAERPQYLYKAFEAGMTPEQISQQSGIDRWFIEQLGQIFQLQQELNSSEIEKVDAEFIRQIKEAGFSDRQLADAWGCEPAAARNRRESLGVSTKFRLVDTCAAEFEAYTPYFYSSYGDENEITKSDKRKIMILGGGPNRIGQGIEFDYCCVHASFALREAGFETVMINSNPETVSTDYDVSDRLYFEPLTLEDVLEVYHQENCDGAIVQYGGQTPLNLAAGLKEAGVNVIGTSPESIDLAEDREKFKQILGELGLKQPQNETALLPEDAKGAAARIGYPILLRPSFVLGGRGMFIVYDEEELEAVVKEAFAVAPGKPVLLDKFLEEAIELDVDCISDGEMTVVGGMLQHIEFAGVHSGDAAMVLPPHDLPQEVIDEVRQASYDLAKALKVIGLMNIQFAIKDGELFLIEVNPRASRTIPFVSKAIGVPLAKLGARVMAGAKLKDLGFTEEIRPKHWAIKESVFPFSRFPGSPIVLTPEMRSTGEVMGQDEDFGMAYAKTQMAAKPPLPLEGNIFLSVKDSDKPKALEVARGLSKLGFSFYSTEGTADFLNANGIEAESVLRISEGRPNVADLIKNGKIQLVINTPLGLIPRRDENAIRSEAVLHSVPIITTLGSAFAALDGIRSLKDRKFSVKALQDYSK